MTNMRQINKRKRKFRFQAAICAWVILLVALCYTYVKFMPQLNSYGIKQGLNNQHGQTNHVQNRFGDQQYPGKQSQQHSHSDVGGEGGTYSTIQDEEDQRTASFPQEAEIQDDSDGESGSSPTSENGEGQSSEDQTTEDLSKEDEEQPKYTYGKLIQPDFHQEGDGIIQAQLLWQQFRDSVLSFGPNGDQDPIEQFGFPIVKEFGSVEPNSHDCCEQLKPLKVDLNSKTLNRTRLIIGGAQKAGTTFLTVMIVQHWRFRVPQCPISKIAKLRRRRRRNNLFKETHFFDNAFLSGKDIEVYNSGWESRMEFLMSLKYFQNGAEPILFEATPSYMRFPYVPCRMKKLWPGVKVVLVLRDPVDRALSQYRMDYSRNVHKANFSSYIHSEIQALNGRQCTFQGKHKRLQKSFGDCFRCEFQRLAKYCYSLLNSEEYAESDRLMPQLDYLTRGMYAPILAWYLRYIKPEDLLIMEFSQLFDDPLAHANKIANFVGQPNSYTYSMIYDSKGKLRSGLRSNSMHFGTKKMSAITQLDMLLSKPRLAEFYKDLNQQLYGLLAKFGYASFPRFVDHSVESVRDEAEELVNQVAREGGQINQQQVNEWVRQVPGFEGQSIVLQQQGTTDAPVVTAPQTVEGQAENDPSTSSMSDSKVDSENQSTESRK